MRFSGGATFPRVVALLKSAVAKSGQRAIARATGIALLSIQRYLKSEGEPTTATLQKLADYFGVSVAWLREEPGEALPELAELLEHDLKEKSLDEIAAKVGIGEEVLRLFAERKDRPSKEMLQRLESYFDVPIFGLDKGFEVDDKLVAGIISELQGKPEFAAVIRSIEDMIKKDNPALPVDEVQAATKATLCAMVTIVKSELE